MNLWLIKLWRLGLTRDGGHVAIGGWRKLWWRVWWDMRIPDAPGIQAVKPDTWNLLRPPPVLHYRPTYHEYLVHFCGADPKAPWTNVFETVTCPACQEKAGPVVLQYRTHYR